MGPILGPLQWILLGSYEHQGAVNNLSILTGIRINWGYLHAFA